MSMDKSALLARSQGKLAKLLYLVEWEAAGPVEAVLANLEPHIAYQQKLEADGVTFGAGPTLDDDTAVWLGGGLNILRVTSQAEAEAIASGDPMSTSGARRFKVRPWIMNEGTIRLSLNHSTQTYRLD